MGQGKVSRHSPPELAPNRMVRAGDKRRAAVAAVRGRGNVGGATESSSSPPRTKRTGQPSHQQAIKAVRGTGY